MIRLTYLTAVLFVVSCESALDEKVYSELGSDALNSEEGANAVLHSAYGEGSLLAMGLGGVGYYFTSTMPSGEAWNKGGNVEAQLNPLTNFTWDANLNYFNQCWSVPYEAIRDANLLIAGIPETDLEEGLKTNIVAEATFIRGFSYALLYNWFGPVPLVTPETAGDYYPGRATDEAVRAFIENDLRAAAGQLPERQDDYGRATRGAALGALCKFYLNTRQWEKTVEVAREIIQLERPYELLPDYNDVFRLDNEGNNELLWTFPRHALNGAQFINALSFPTDYPLAANQSVYAARTYFFDDFVDSYLETDRRKDLFVKEYTNTSGEHIQLFGSDKTLSLKYEFDPGASGPGMGNDIPVIRYSDILLSLAEALNELHGPNQESVDLLNQVWQRANQDQAAPVTLGGFTKESLRARIYQEREWEFFSEAKRREDQIRMGTFVSKAVARGKRADAHHVVFPIPQTEISANPNLRQNEGY
ncbi:RagB/SusD family nutrient uptake outer membrane protein [Sinomicrobium oceani]|nr:RagB/SusD family nutrient uptake outer membrane protein [Sinomicrobium oceani]